ncbi:hypothetical protein JEO88_03155 [Candidatus Saccharibacteria bacterium]|jgi:hypothetical protein|nr:hypothetical protein [Candidatus Saccharibacteria bacterium]
MVRLYLRGKYSLADFEESFIAYIKGEDYALTFSAQHVPLRVTITSISVSRCSNKIISFSARLESGHTLDCRYHLEQGYAKTNVSQDFYYYQIYKNYCKSSPVFTGELPSGTIEIIAGPSREEMLENFIARLESKRRKACVFRSNCYDEIKVQINSLTVDETGWGFEFDAFIDSRKLHIRYFPARRRGWGYFDPTE